jgi:hypothetical protein
MNEGEDAPVSVSSPSSKTKSTDVPRQDLLMNLIKEHPTIQKKRPTPDIPVAMKQPEPFVTLPPVSGATLRYFQKRSIEVGSGPRIHQDVGTTSHPRRAPAPKILPDLRTLQLRSVQTPKIPPDLGARQPLILAPRDFPYPTNTDRETYSGAVGIETGNKNMTYTAHVLLEGEAGEESTKATKSDPLNENNEMGKVVSQCEPRLPDSVVSSNLKRDSGQMDVISSADIHASHYPDQRPEDKRRRVSMDAASPQEPELICEVLCQDEYGIPNTVGLIVLSSHEATFSCARNEIEKQELLGSKQWHFVHPSLGSICPKEEGKSGPLLTYFRETMNRRDVRLGTKDDPLELLVREEH